MKCYNTSLAGNFLSFFFSISFWPPWTKLAACKPEAIGRGIAIRASLVQVGNKKMLQRKLIKSQSKECCIIFCQLECHCSQSLKKHVMFIWKRINKTLHKVLSSLFIISKVLHLFNMKFFILNCLWFVLILLNWLFWNKDLMACPYCLTCLTDLMQKSDIFKLQACYLNYRKDILLNCVNIILS